MSNSYNEHQRNMYNCIKKSTSYTNLMELSSKGKSRQVIELIMKIDKEISKIQIHDCFVCKNNTESEQIFKSFNLKAENNIEILNRALIAAKVNAILYMQIIMQRVRFWYKMRMYAECLQDIQFLINQNNDNIDFHIECKIECYLLQNEVYKNMKEAEKARNALNKAMAELNNLAQKSCKSDDEDNIKQTKQNLLHMFLLKLNKQKQNKCQPNSLNNNNNNNNNNEITIPKLYGQAHNVLKSCSDSVTLDYDNVRGRYLYATKDIPVGSTIIVDRAFSSCINQYALHTNCLHCYTSLNIAKSIVIPCNYCQTVMFCSERCRDLGWTKFHEYECSILNIISNNEMNNPHILLAYRTSITQLITKSRHLNKDNLLSKTIERDIQKKKNELSSTYDSLDYKSVCTLESHCAEIDANENLVHAVRAVFFTKCIEYMLNKIANITLDEMERVLVADSFLRHIQIINCNAYEIVENVYDAKSQIWEPRNLGGAIYATVSLTNHSCYPNVVRHSYPEAIVVVRTIRAIKKGDEILDNYGPHFLTTSKAERQKYLLQKYHFNCCCEACNNNWSMNLSTLQFKFKCSACFTPFNINAKSIQCSVCQFKINLPNAKKKIKESDKKNRQVAISLMLQNKYQQALILLLKHLNVLDIFVSSPNLDIIKTQQAIIQCYNSLSLIHINSQF